MARNYPDWVLGFSDNVLLARFGRDTVHRGRDYAQRGRVGSINVGGASRELASATVRGSSYRSYQTLLRYTGGPSGTVVTNCSCPVNHDCKHAVALLLHMRNNTVQSRTPSWQRLLGELTSEAARADHGQPLALQFTRTPSDDLDLRPLVWGKSGRWVRTGATWEGLSHDYREEFRSDQRQALLAVRAATREQGGYGSSYYYSRGADLALSECRVPVWRALRDAAGAGVEFVSGADTGPVRLVDEPATLHVDVTGSLDAGLHVGARLAVVGAGSGSRFRLLGTPAHGVVAHTDEAVLLAAFQAPLSSAQHNMVRQHTSITVPASDIPSFVAGYYPVLSRLGHVHADPELALPEVSAPLLACDITTQPNHAASLRFGFAYSIGDRVIEVGVRPDPEDQVIRDRVAERDLVAKLPAGPWLVTNGGVTQPADVVVAGRECIDLMTRVVPALRAVDGVRVTVHGEVPDYREATTGPQITISVGDPGVTDWFNLDVDVSVGGEKVPFAELFRALALGEDHLVIDSGTWFSLDRPELEQLRQLIAEAQQLAEPGETGLRLRVEHAGLWEELVSLGVVAEQSAAWTSAVSGLLDVASLPDPGLPSGLNATLRPYQEAGYRWLSTLWTTRLGGILADDMGLGKTLQALALITSTREREGGPPALVVAPTSVLGTWASEAARFTPGLRVAVVGETRGKAGVDLDDAIGGADLVVTSYTLLRLDEEHYIERDWSTVVLDEAQFVKNRQAKVYQAVRKLRARTKFAVTGTPLENNLMDLWSLLSITSPGLFPNPEKFSETFRKPIESGDKPALARLHRRIRPLMLRRTKESVATELPPKQEQVLAVQLSPVHRRIYDRQLQAERKKVLGLVGDLTRNRIQILTALTRLRQLSLSPALVDAGPPHSAKIDTLLELLTEVTAEGHRALVFSQFTSFLSLVRERLGAERISYQYLDGRTRDRQARVQAFRDGDDPVFLISLKAGGFGLTLTEADYVFILDPWWNPAAELQAIDRTHRIGQDKHVMVYRLVSADTIEEKVVALQERKRDLFAKVVGSGGDVAAPLSAADIRGLLDL